MKQQSAGGRSCDVFQFTLTYISMKARVKVKAKLFEKKGSFEYLNYITVNSSLHVYGEECWQNVIGSYHKVHYIEFACILSYRTRYAVMSYSVMMLYFGNLI